MKDVFMNGVGMQVNRFRVTFAGRIILGALLSVISQNAFSSYCPTGYDRKVLEGIFLDAAFVKDSDYYLAPEFKRAFFVSDYLGGDHNRYFINFSQAGGVGMSILGISSWITFDRSRLSYSKSPPKLQVGLYGIPKSYQYQPGKYENRPYIDQGVKRVLGGESCTYFSHSNEGIGHTENNNYYLTIALLLHSEKFTTRDVRLSNSRCVMDAYLEYNGFKNIRSIDSALLLRSVGGGMVSPSKIFHWLVMLPFYAKLEPGKEYDYKSIKNIVSMELEKRCDKE